MKFALLSGVALLLMWNGPAAAADALQDQAMHDWSGFYVGANAGHGWGRKEDLDLSMTLQQDLEDSSLDLLRTVRGIEPEGFFGGGQAGYNFQTDALVFGIEADIQKADISGFGPWTPETDTFLVNSIKFRGAEEYDWLGTFRGRLGWAVTDTVLLYATGGLAFGDGGAQVETSFAYTPEDTAIVKTGDDGFHLGYSLGGGVELALSQRWSVKLEYQYLDLGDSSVKETRRVPVVETVAGYTLSMRTHDIDLQLHTIRMGVNFHF